MTTRKQRSNRKGRGQPFRGVSPVTHFPQLGPFSHPIVHSKFEPPVNETIHSLGQSLYDLIVTGKALTDRFNVIKLTLTINHDNREGSGGKDTPYRRTCYLPVKAFYLLTWLSPEVGVDAAKVPQHDDKSSHACPIPTPISFSS